MRDETGDPSSLDSSLIPHPSSLILASLVWQCLVCQKILVVDQPPFRDSELQGDTSFILGQTHFPC
jgi:hypothetical protein